MADLNQIMDLDGEIRLRAARLKEAEQEMARVLIENAGELLERGILSVRVRWGILRQELLKEPSVTKR